MRKMMTFTFGVLVGTIVATAWANFSKLPDRGLADRRSRPR